MHNQVQNDGGITANPPVTVTQIRAEAKRLRSMGWTYLAISEFFSKAGVVSPRIGRPYTFGGVHSLINHKKIAKRMKGYYKSRSKQPTIQSPTNTFNFRAELKHISAMNVPAAKKWALTEVLL